MVKKKMIAMLLAGGQGSRLGVLTADMAKPAVSFGGKYRIIDFPLSNCVNSGVDTVGVLTQYRPLQLNAHIGIGIPWDLDKRVGGVSILPPYEKTGDTGFYSGTANAIYQNLEFIERYNPDYVLILSGDHIYKMDYEEMLAYHQRMGADVTLASMPVPWEEASRFGVVITDEDKRITAFQEKPKEPKSNLASMGIYIFNWKLLHDALVTLKDVPGCDFGKHVIPYCFEQNKKLYTYEFTGYWKDVGTLSSYWQANMELVDLVPEFNLYEEFWKIYTETNTMTPEYMAPTAKAERAIICGGSEIFGTVSHSVIGSNVQIGEGSVIEDSIIMEGVRIGKNVRMKKAIVADNTVIGDGTVIGEGEYAPSHLDTRVYNSELATIAANSRIPGGVSIGLNTAISGATEESDYPNGRLEDGGYIIKAGEKA